MLKAQFAHVSVFGFESTILGWFRAGGLKEGEILGIKVRPRARLGYRGTDVKVGPLEWH
jgi:hypothetical protein